jgi:hypothetical protein
VQEEVLRYVVIGGGPVGCREGCIKSTGQPPKWSRYGVEYGWGIDAACNDDARGLRLIHAKGRESGDTQDGIVVLGETRAPVETPGGRVSARGGGGRERMVL